MGETQSAGKRGLTGRWAGEVTTGVSGQVPKTVADAPSPDSSHHTGQWLHLEQEAGYGPRTQVLDEHVW